MKKVTRHNPAYDTAPIELAHITHTGKRVVDPFPWRWANKEDALHDFERMLRDLFPERMVPMEIEVEVQDE
jgi:hypothetical protein